MPRKNILSALFASILAVAPASFAQEASVPVEKAEAPKQAAPDVAGSRSLAYDSATIQRLYKDAKAKNEKRAQQFPDHINTDNLDYVELKPFQVEGTDIDFQRKLVEKLEPRPRQRLARIAAFDPEEANIMMAQVRGDKEFMMGTYDKGRPAGGGSTANFDQNQLLQGLNKALDAVKNAVGKSDKEESEDSNQR